jgi:hypothetical protein
MWLAISSIVLAFAIGLDVLALLLTYTERNTNANLPARWAPSEPLSTLCL